MQSLGHKYQVENYTCGPNAISIVLDYFGVENTVADLILKCKSSPSHGSRQNDLLLALDEYGVKTITFVRASFEDFQPMLDNGYVPIINYFNFMTGHGHFSVVRSVSTDKIILSDPKNGPHFEIEKDKFIENWHNMDKTIYGWVTFIKE